MNRSPSMMAALGLDAEETSLDHMLRDLGFGDGTPATRQSALQKATDQYERDISSGLLTNLMRGRLVQLLLVQVQQLKVGLLSALDTIDVLLQGNRINLQVLAAIPAFVDCHLRDSLFLAGIVQHSCQRYPAYHRGAWRDDTLSDKHGECFLAFGSCQNG